MAAECTARMHERRLMRGLTCWQWRIYVPCPWRWTYMYCTRLHLPCYRHGVGPVAITTAFSSKPEQVSTSLACGICNMSATCAHFFPSISAPSQPVRMVRTRYGFICSIQKTHGRISAFAGWFSARLRHGTCDSCRWHSFCPACPG